MIIALKNSTESISTRNKRMRRSIISFSPDDASSLLYLRRAPWPSSLQYHGQRGVSVRRVGALLLIYLKWTLPRLSHTLRPHTEILDLLCYPQFYLFFEDNKNKVFSVFHFWSWWYHDRLRLPNFTQLLVLGECFTNCVLFSRINYYISLHYYCSLQQWTF